jgi:hypothetical protein
LGVPPSGSPPYGLAFGSVLRTRFAALQAAHAKNKTQKFGQIEKRGYLCLYILNEKIYNHGFK